MSAVVAAACVGPQACDESDGGDKLSACSPDVLANAHLLGARKFERARGKPTTESLHFEVPEAQDICVVIQTGTISATGEILEKPTSSLTAAVDGLTPVFSPNGFNAHPKQRSRLVPALAAGEHSLEVQIRGQGVAHIAILGASESPTKDPSWLPSIQVSRLEEPGDATTRLRDEALLALNNDRPIEAVNEALTSLPFPATVVGRLEDVPIYRVFLSGASGGQDLDDRLDSLGSLPGVAAVSSYFIGGVSTMDMMPLSGRDRHYVEEGEFTDGAWHLREMNARYAWAPNTVNTTFGIGVVDNGFNIENLGLVGNLRTCWGPQEDSEGGGNFIASTACSEADPGDWDPAWFNTEHGTAVAGLAGASGGDILPGDWRDTVGVAWSVPLDLARFDNENITNDDPSAFDRFLDQVATADGTAPQTVEDFRSASMYANLVVANKMAASGVRVINFSFGQRVFNRRDQDAPFDLVSPFDHPATALNTLNGIIDQHRGIWEVFLGERTDLLLVQAAGNDGHKCTASGLDARFCSTEARGYGCAAVAHSDRVLCVGASDNLNEVDDLTNHGGDLLAAPGVDVLVLDYGESGGEGTLLTGTSVSAPLVSGAAAILLGIDPSLRPEQLHEILLSPGEHSDIFGSREYQILDLAAAVQSARCRNGLVNSEPESDACPVFDDVSGHWAEPVITKLACDCVLQGHPDGTFRPDEVINRAEALKVILMLALDGEPLQFPDEDPYLDVDKDVWFSPYVAYAQGEGWLDFLVSDYFEPSAPIERRAFARLLVAAAQHSDVEEFGRLFELFEEGGTPTVEYGDAATFGQCPAGANAALNDPLCFARFIQAASGRCLMSGYEDGNFGPLDSLTRAQASKVGCYAYYGYGSTECGEPDQECMLAGE